MLPNRGWEFCFTGGRAGPDSASMGPSTFLSFAAGFTFRLIFSAVKLRLTLLTFF
jgi:hypothetical protein